MVHKNETNSGGAKWNFWQMLLTYQDDYVMLCDQDDVWLPNKIQITLDAMQRHKYPMERMLRFWCTLTLRLWTRSFSRSMHRFARCRIWITSALP